MVFFVIYEVIINYFVSCMRYETMVLCHVCCKNEWGCVMHELRMNVFVIYQVIINYLVSCMKYETMVLCHV